MMPKKPLFILGFLFPIPASLLQATTQSVSIVTVKHGVSGQIPRVQLVTPSYPTSSPFTTTDVATTLKQELESNAASYQFMTLEPALMDVTALEPAMPLGTAVSANDDASQRVALHATWIHPMPLSGLNPTDHLSQPTQSALLHVQHHVGLLAAPSSQLSSILSRYYAGSMFGEFGPVLADNVAGTPILRQVSPALQSELLFRHLLHISGLEIPRIPGRPRLLTAVAADLLLMDLTHGNPNDAVRDTAKGLGITQIRDLLALGKILHFAKHADQNRLAFQLVRAAAQWYARDYNRNSKEWSAYTPLHVPIRGEVWDLASIPLPGGHVFHRLNPQVRYKFFDLSLFVKETLEETLRLLRAQGLPLDNVEIVRADVRKLSASKQPLAVIHMKNLTAYVPDFVRSMSKLPSPLEIMLVWLGQGGQLVVRNDPTPGQRKEIIGQFGQLGPKLIREGWGFEFTLGKDLSSTRWSWDSLVFTKPGPKLQPSQVQWENYVETARRLPK